MTPRAQTFVAQNLPALCVETMQWRKEGFIRGGMLRQLQNLLAMPVTDPLSMSTAVAMVDNAALLYVIGDAHAKQAAKVAPVVAPVQQKVIQTGVLRGAPVSSMARKSKQHLAL